MKTQGVVIEGFELSPQQKRLWNLLREAPVFAAGCSVELTGKLDASRLEEAFGAVVRAHEILRTAFAVRPGEEIPCQVICDDYVPELRQLDLSNLSEAELETEIKSLRSSATINDASISNNYQPGSLLDAALIRIAEDKHVLIINLSALCVDAGSLASLVMEIGRAYEAEEHGAESLDEPMQYADVARWLNDLGESEDQDAVAGRAYWNSIDISAAHQLTIAFENKNAVAPFRPEAQSIALSEELQERIRTAAANLGAPIPVLMLACWKILLSRLTRQPDIVVGYVADGKKLDEISDALGPFSRIVPTRSLVEGNTSLTAILEVMADRIEEASDWQEYFDWNRTAVIDGAPGSIPFLPICFEFHSRPPSRQFGGVRFTIDEQHACTDRFKLKLSCANAGETLRAEIQFDASRYERNEIERLADRYEVLLRSAIENPHGSIETLTLLTGSESRYLLNELNDTRTEYPHGSCIHELIEEQARQAPDAPAAVFEEHWLSYGELNARANSVASHLRGAGVGPESMVGLCVERSLEMVIGLFGILKAGGAYVPLDPKWPADRVDLMIEDSGATVVLTRRSIAERLPAVSSRAVFFDAIEANCVWNVVSGVSSKNAAYVIYTSGSTGAPKGVVIPHRQIVNYTRACADRLGFSPASSFAMVQPLTVDSSKMVLFDSLSMGGCLHILSEEASIDPNALANYFTEHIIDGLKIAPSHLAALLTSARPERLIPRKWLVVGGEASRPDWVKELAKLAPDCEIFYHYGPTEATVGVQKHRVLPDRLYERALTVPVGRPLPNTRAYLVDHQFQPTPAGVVGDLLLGGTCLARGYLNRPDLTAERFIPNTFSEDCGARLYATGDLARRLPDGSIEFLGRGDHQVKIRGFRIELGEIEAVLARHGSVREVTVVDWEQSPNRKELVAFIVPEQTPAPSTAELRGFLQERLPEYMVPAAFVFIDSMPRTAHGKLDRKALVKREPLLAEAHSDFAAPRGPVEETLARIWGELLGTSRVGVHDNFFELGGDSIIGIQVISRANRAGLRLTPRQIFQHQTVAALAAVAGTATASEPRRGLVTGPVRLTPIQHRLFETTTVELNRHNQSLMLELRQQFDAAHLSKVVDRLLDHHDALRMRFHRQDDIWTQENLASERNVVFVVIDLSGIPDVMLRSEIERTAVQVQESLDLSEGPLVRIAKMDLGEARGERLLISIHHTVMDGVSWRILLEDLAAGYEQAQRGLEIDFGGKTSSYQEWGEALTSYADGDEIGKETEYWIERSGEKTGRLPVDYQSGENTVGSRRAVRVALDEGETRDLLTRAGEAYRTRIQEVLVCALSEALSEWTGNDRVKIEIEGHGREDIASGIDVTRTIGWFTSVYPLIIDFDRKSGSGEKLKSVKEQMRRVPNQGIGYGILRYLSADEHTVESLKQQGDAEVVFNYFGQLDNAASPSQFAMAPEDKGSDRSERAHRIYLLDVVGDVAGGVLTLSFWYSENRHRRETIERLALRCRGALSNLIAHCLSEGAGGYTPSDFELVDIQQSDLDRIAASGGEIQDLYPLTPMQQGMLFHTLYSPKSGVYCNQAMASLVGDLDVNAFRQSWQEVLDRHEALRTSFEWEGVGEPVQVVWKHVNLEIREEDWRGKDKPARDAQAERYLREERERGIDVRRAPLMRMTLIREGEQEYRYIWSRHHLLMDGWCMPVVLREVMRKYEAKVNGRELDLGEAARYRDYIEWLKRQDISEAEQYWREKLKGLAGAAGIGVKTLSAGGGVTGQGKVEIRLGEFETRAILDAARRQQLTVNTMVQGAWALLLSKYSGEEEVVFGATVSGRPPELEAMENAVGLFINTLPVRVIVDEREQVKDWLKRIQDEQVEMRQYEYSRLVDVQRWSGKVGGESLFESILVFENYPVDNDVEGDGGGVVIKDVRFEEQTNYPLTVDVASGRDLGVRVSYDRREYEEETIKRLTHNFVAALTSIAESMSRPVRALEVMSKAEISETVYEWNETAVDYNLNQPIHEAIEEQAGRTPDRIALEFDDEVLTYHGLNEEANKLARFLRRKGVGVETLAGVCMQRGLETIVALFGVLKSGGAFVPLDPEYPDERLAYMTRDAGLKVMLAQSEHLEKLRRIEAEVICVDERRSEIQKESGEDFASEATPDSLAYVIYTSGSTGQPKGAMNSHQGIANRLRWMQDAYRIGEEDLMAQKTPYTFDDSVVECFWPLMEGARLVITRPGGHRDSAYLASFIEERRITTIHFVPAMMRVFLDEMDEGACGTLRRVISSGEALPAEMASEFMSKSAAELHNLYGPAEAAVDVTYWDCERRDEPRSIPIGRPIANLRIHLVDRNLHPVPAGVAGELCVGGVGVGRGYLSRADLTAAKFIPDPFGKDEGRRLYRTGDLARYSFDGTIEYIGRTDYQVKIRGVRIELGEIEIALMEHEAVKEAVVVAREDESEGTRLVAYITPVAETAPSQSELRRHLRMKLPESMAPSIFVTLDRMPVSSNGKIDRKSLPEPGRSRPELETAAISARTPIEELLASIWSQVLRVDQVGVFDNFFELGGHSLLATQVMARVRDAFGVEVALRAIFDNPTIAALARFLECAADSGKALIPPITRASRDGALPLSFAQQRLWFFDRLYPGTPLYNIATAVRLRGELDVDSLERALDSVVRRHEVLRTTFAEVDGRPVQVINDDAVAPPARIDLSALDPEAAEAESRRLAVEASRHSFDLTRGAMLVVRLIQLAAHDYVGVLTMHHIVGDGWSFEVLVREIARLYNSFTTGEESPLEELPVQYADYAVWQEQLLRGDIYDRQVEYWKDQLQNIPALLKLPIDRPRSEMQSNAGDRAYLEIGPELTEALRELGRREGVTQYMTFLAAYQTLLRRYTEQEEIVVGSPSGGRSRVEMEPLIGLFVNTLAMKTDFTGNPSFRDLLHRVRETVLGAHANQDLPFDKLVEILRPERTLKHTPIVQVWFVFMNTSPVEFNLPGLTLSFLPTDPGAAKLDLGLTIMEQEDTVTAGLQYKTELFDSATVREMLRHFEIVLETMTSHPEWRVLDFPLLSEENEFAGVISDLPNVSDAESSFLF